MSTPRPASKVQPGWYADPADAKLIRYWDGASWSSHTQPRPQPYAQPEVQPYAQPVVPPGSAKRSWWKRPRNVVVALVLMFVAFTTLVDGDETPSGEAVPPASEPADSGRADSSKAESDSTDPEAVDATAAKPKPRKASVPGVVGLGGKEARRKLEAAGLVFYIAREVPSPRPVGTILRQLEAAGASLRKGSSVGLVVAAPYPTVPGTAGMAQDAATQRLRSAGFQVRVVQEVVTSGQDGVVLRQAPMGSLRARPDSVVTVVVANLVRPVVAPPPAGCTPGYSPCLAPASDYDCEGGSGDGPSYTGLVRVTGADIYDLDRDGDGVACES